MSIKNPNDPRAVRTRKLLIDTLFELMFQRRWEEITVQEIVEKATLNRATFYAHFADKNALLEHAAEASFREDLSPRLEALPPGSPLLPRTVLGAVCEHLRGIHVHCSRTLTPMESFEPLMERTIQEQVETAFAAWIRSRPSARLPATPARAATAAAWATYGLARQWARDPSLPVLEDFLKETAPLVEALTGG